MIYSKRIEHDKIFLEYLDFVRGKVAYYQPLIEERTGLDLGKIGVKESKRLLEDKLKYWLNDEEIHLWLRLMLLPFTMVLSNQKIKSTILAIKFRNNIYIPEDNYSINILKDELSGKKQETDQIVVHELTHEVWFGLGGNKSDKEMIQEGYALYGEMNWFEDFYPSGKHSLQNLPPIEDLRYKQEIEQLVKLHGEQILFDIPRDWKEYLE